MTTATAEIPIEPATRRPRRARRGHAGAAWMLSAPALILMAAILLAPMGVAGYLSFTDYSLGASDFRWVGLENYDRLFSRSRYAAMFSATFAYILVVAPLSVGLGLGAALLIDGLRRGREIYKTIYFLPVMATLMAMAIVWELMLHPTIGVVNATLEAGCEVGWLRGLLTGAWAGLAPEATWYGRGCAEGFPLWLGDRDYAFWTLCFIGVWQGFGFNMVLFLAGLTAVPRELHHAAEMDGARGGWEKFRLVTWPMLGPTTVFVVTITTIRSFQVFDTVEALFPSGGPGKSAYVMMFALYEKGIQQNLVGIGAAITVLFLGMVMVITLVQRRLVERKVHYA